MKLESFERLDRFSEPPAVDHLQEKLQRLRHNFQTWMISLFS
jgi:hypothetical protein